MASQLRRLVGVGLTVVLAAGLLSAAGPARGDSMTEIVLVHDSHVHGNLETGKTNIAQKDYILEQIRSKNANVVFVGNGDDLGTSVLSSVFHGSHVVDAFNTMGMQVDTFGNHDFDEGPANTLKQVKASKFPWVTANLRDKATGATFGSDAGVKPFVIQEIAGVKIGFTGLAPADTPTLTSIGPDITVLDPTKAMAEVVPQMRAAGAQVVVMLSHLTGPDAEVVVKQVPGIDVVVGDHAAQILDQPLQIGTTYLSRVGDEFKAVGELHLFVSGGKLDHISFVKTTITDKTPADPTMAALVKKYNDQLSAALKDTIGYTMAPLNGIKSDNRWHETLMGDVAADILRTSMSADIGLINGGGIRLDRILPLGPVTKGDMQGMFPFTNYVVKLQLTGEQLKTALENSVSNVDKGDGRFMQVSGISFKWDPTATVGSRVSQIKVSGKDLDPAGTYTAATVDFEANGGDGYAVLKETKVLVPAAGGPLMSTLIQSKLGYVYPQELNRIRFAKADFTAGKASMVVSSGHNMTAAPFIENGTFYVPVRFVGEIYGALVIWTGEGVKLQYQGAVTPIAGKLVGSTYFVPVQDLAKVLGLQVQGSGETITVVDPR